MQKWEKILHPRLWHRKRRGEFVEAAFQAKAMAQGLTVCKPCSETEPFDFVVFNVRRAMNRVQVKSAWSRWNRRNCYRVMPPKGRRFNRGETDVLVVALPEADVWYVVPIDAVAGHKAAHFYPHDTSGKQKLEEYREAWHLLTGDEPGAWERYQRFTIHAQRE